MQPIFHIDPLSVIMMVLVGFVAIVVSVFSNRYLAGNRDRVTFYVNLAILVVALFVMVCADQAVIFLLAWAGSNYFLVRLMAHKRLWPAAQASARLAFKNFIIGFVFVGIGFVLLYEATGSMLIHTIIHTNVAPGWFYPAVACLFVGVMTQSAVWPFHRWLTSSLNSPTPVSAIMHAGLVNGGGFLLTRFAPLLLSHPDVLMVIFAFGIFSAFLGTFWKLLQHDVKRMLACSTVGQMGFMVAQCGLGLFPAAVAHLCWHGLYKANLFLGSASAVREKKVLPEQLTVRQVVLAIVCGLVGAIIFATISQDEVVWHTTPLILNALAFITGAQFALPVLARDNKVSVFIALILVVAMSLVYGGSVRLVEQSLLTAGLWAPQPMNLIYWLGLVLLMVSWLAMLLKQVTLRGRGLAWALRLYVWAFNGSQPHPKTVTTHRNDYQC
jgi:NAD(P)H-quinone oxidoreductase subunit 5